MSLSEQIVSDLTAAMKSQDAQRTSTLRMVKSAMMNRKIEKGADLDDDDVQKLLRSLVKQRRDSIEQYEKAGRQELVDKEAAEITVIETYLPQAASAAEIEQAAEGGTQRVIDAAGHAGADDELRALGGADLGGRKGHSGHSDEQADDEEMAHHPHERPPLAEPRGGGDQSSRARRGVREWHSIETHASSPRSASHSHKMWKSLISTTQGPLTVFGQSLR